MSRMLFIILVMASLQVVHVTSYNLRISPDYLSVTNNSNDVAFMCSAGVPLFECQFRFWDTSNNREESPLVDLSEGPQSQTDPDHLDVALNGYSYRGRGLGAGDCGVALKVVRQRLWMVACRVRTENEGWKYAWAELFAWNGNNLPHTLTPTEAVVLPGEPVSFVLKATKALDACIFYPHGSWRDGHLFNQGARSNQSTGRHRYFGAGLERGECGLTLTNVSEADNGPVRCHIESTGWITDMQRIMALIVARPPTAPILNLTYTGNLVTATCEVKEGRPVAQSITWLLGNEVIRQNDVDDLPAGQQDAWRWPWMRGSIRQSITLQLQPQHDGKQLKCRVSHVALDRPLQSKQQITLRAAPDSITMCPPLTSQTVLISCYSLMAGLVPVNCSEPQHIGNEARLACKPGFTLPITVIYRKVTCLSNGVWNRPVFVCHPDCGRRITYDGDLLISPGGKGGKIGEFPWHVGLYEVMPGTGNTAQMCGGTLITPRLVLTAAHCIWNSTSKKDARNLKVAAGKDLRAWEDPNPNVQKRNVKEIVQHELFRGRNTDYSYNIAILRLESPFDINIVINLVCLDWDNVLERQQLKYGSLGVVAGWGFTTDGVQSESLKYVQLPYVRQVTCLDALPRSQQRLISADKMCAGFANSSSSVCGDDTGGGLVFPQNGTGKYYLRGVTSMNFKPYDDSAVCFSQHYMLFSMFSRYIIWIQDHME